MIQLTDVVKQLVIINAIIFVGTMFLPPEILVYFRLYFPLSPEFQPVQLITHMFMHASPMHIFWNMFALIMFGPALEARWGHKKFLFFYLACGIGSALAHVGVQYYEYTQIAAQLAPDVVGEILSGNIRVNTNNGPAAQELWGAMSAFAVGASGAVMGVEIAFALLYPNRELRLLFIPIPVKAKHLIPAMVALDLFLGLSSFQTGIAHFAHIGGAITGALLVLFWNETSQV